MFASRARRTGLGILMSLLLAVGAISYTPSVAPAQDGGCICCTGCRVEGDQIVCEKCEPQECGETCG